jgi:hypothetical protein
MASNDLQIAKSNILKAAHLDPKSRDIRKGLDEVNKRIEEDKQLHKLQPQLFQGIFNKS